MISYMPHTNVSLSSFLSQAVAWVLKELGLKLPVEVLFPKVKLGCRALGIQIRSPGSGWWNRTAILKPDVLVPLCELEAPRTQWGWL